MVQIRVCNTQYEMNSVHTEIWSFSTRRLVIIVLLLPIKYSVSYWYILRKSFTTTRFHPKVED